MGSVPDRISLKSCLTALTAVLLLAPVITPLLAPVIAGPAWVFPILSTILIAVGLTAIRYWQLTSDSETGDDGSVWTAIPSRQYDGRHVESGGLARGEQEAAIEEIQQQAAGRERDR